MEALNIHFLLCRFTLLTAVSRYRQTWRDTVMAGLDSDIGMSGYSGERSQMKRLLIVALIAHMLLLSQLRDSCAAGPYDGEWTGSATPSTGGRCRPANVTLTVQGKVVTGQAKFEVDAASISGTVSEDGTFGATIGFQPLAGEFMQDQFKGAFKNGDCAWNLVLKRTKQ